MARVLAVGNQCAHQLDERIALCERLVKQGLPFSFPPFQRCSSISRTLIGGPGSVRRPGIRMPGRFSVCHRKGAMR